MKYNLILSVIFLFSLSLSSSAQNAAQSSPSDRAIEEQNTPNSIDAEIQAKRAIRYAEDAHKENLERAREVSLLGSKLERSFLSKNTLDRDDNKRLDRMEKLAKQLRNKAGGSDSEEALDQPPADLNTAISRIAETSESLGKLVEKTPRQVVSAAVIDEANVLLQLIRIVRQFSKR